MEQRWVVWRGGAITLALRGRRSKGEGELGSTGHEREKGGKGKAPATNASYCFHVFFTILIIVF